MNATIEKVKSNPMGLVLGAGAGFLVAKKLVKTEKMWVLVAITLAGGIAGALAQSHMKAKKGVPTAATTK